MKKCIFAGDWTMEKVVGVQRYAGRILLELDKMIGRGEYKGVVGYLIHVYGDLPQWFLNL